MLAALLNTPSLLAIQKLVLKGMQIGLQTRYYTLGNPCLILLSTICLGWLLCWNLLQLCYRLLSVVLLHHAC